MAALGENCMVPHFRSLQVNGLLSIVTAPLTDARSLLHPSNVVQKMPNSAARIRL